MKTLNEIQQAVQTIRTHQTTAQNSASLLESELQKVNDGTRSAEYVQQQTVALRAKHTPAITEALQAVTAISTELSASQSAWTDKRHVLAQRSLTAGENFNTPKDAGLEAISRIAKMQELALLPGDLLHSMADAAKGDIRKHGLLHLISIENNSRSDSTPGWSPISLDDVELPDRTQALALLQEMAGARHTMENTFKAAINGRSNPVDRITAARAGGK
jgi:hypothetical protein